VAHLVMAGGFTELFKEDPEAMDAARQAAIDAGEDQPKGMRERMAAGVIGWQGGTFRQTGLAKQRFARSLFQHAALGSEAYVSGQQGNSYTAYLRGRFGDWTPDDDTWAVHMMTDGSSTESPWNPSIKGAAESIAQAGLTFSPDIRAAASSPYVMQLFPSHKKAAIPSVAKYMTEIAKAQYPDAHRFVINSALSRLSSQISKEEVDSCAAIQIESNGRDVNAGTVQGVATLLHSGAVSNGATGYHALRNVASVLANASMHHRTVRGAATLSMAETGSGGGSRLSGAEMSINSNQGVEQQWDIAINPTGGAAGGGTPVQNTTINMPNQSDPGNPLYRIAGVGSSGRGPTRNRADVDVMFNTNDRSQAPAVRNGDVLSAFNGNPLEDASRVRESVQLILEMQKAGFEEDQLQDDHLVSVAHEIHHEAAHLMQTTNVAHKIMGSALDKQSVYVVQDMIDNGWSPNRIQPSQVQAAREIMNAGGIPTQADVSKLIESRRPKDS